MKLEIKLPRWSFLWYNSCMRKYRRANCYFLAIIALALVLRLPLLGGSFWLDEAAQALESARPWSQQLVIPDDFQPPLLHLLTWFSLQVGESEWWLRTVGALIPGLLTIWGAYLLGRKIVSQRVGLLAALLLSTSSFHIFFSQELRPYSLSALWAVWSWLFLLENEREGSDFYQWPKNSRFARCLDFLPMGREMCVYLLITWCGLYTSYLYPFVLASQLLFLLGRRQWRDAVWVSSVSIIGFLPWLPKFLEQLARGQLLRQNFPHWEDIVSFSLWKAPALTVGKFLFGVVDLEINAFFIGSLVVFSVLFIMLIFINV